MASFTQAQQHYAWLSDAERQRAEEEARARDQAAALQQEQQRQLAAQTSQRDYQQLQAQQTLAGQQAGFQNQRDLLLIGNQQQRDYAQHVYGQADRQQAHAQNWDLTNLNAANQWNARIQQNDLHAQLNQTMLTQSEEMDAKRTREAIAAVNRNPDLAPEEKSMLITQLQTKLNPLENRQRQANILHSQIQTQGLHQQMVQQATLFNQDQDFRATGATQRIQSVWNPDTQRNERYMLNRNGELVPLEASSIEQGRQLALIQTGQRISQSAQEFPVHLGIMEETLRNATSMNPLLRDQLLANIANIRATTGHTQASTSAIGGQENRANLLFQGDPNATSGALGLQNANIANLGASTTNTYANTASTLQLTSERAMTLAPRLDQMFANTAHLDMATRGQHIVNRLNTLRGDELEGAMELAATPIGDRQSIIWDPDSQTAANRYVNDMFSPVAVGPPRQDTPEARRTLRDNWLQEHGHGTVVIQNDQGRFQVIRPRTPPPPTWTERLRQTVMGEETRAVDHQLETWRTAYNRWQGAPAATRGEAPPPPAWATRHPLAQHLENQLPAAMRTPFTPADVTEDMRQAAVLARVEVRRRDINAAAQGGVGGAPAPQGGGAGPQAPPGQAPAPGGQGGAPQGAMPPPDQRGIEHVAQVLGVPNPVPLNPQAPANREAIRNHRIEVTMAGPPPRTRAQATAIVDNSWDNPNWVHVDVNR